MTTPSWRIRLTGYEVVAENGPKAADQWLAGAKEYGNEVFTGDPVEHLAEELRDASNYVLYVKRQRDDFANWMVAAVRVLRMSSNSSERTWADYGTELLRDTFPDVNL